MLLGNGDGTFQARETFAGGLFPTALVAGDFNGDGKLDLAEAGNGDSGVSVFLGNGDGTFQAPETLTTGYYSGLTAGDFNGDGNLDLAAAAFNYRGISNISVWLGNGDGTFQAPTTYAELAVPEGLLAADFTGDGNLDLAVANSRANKISVLLGNGDGTFVAPRPVRRHLPHATPLVADVNGDGTSDVLVIDGAGDILYRQGIPGQPGSFEPPVTVNPGYPSRDIAWLPYTDRSPLLASVDAHGQAVSLYAWRDGGFVRIGSPSTGQLPAQSLPPT